MIPLNLERNTLHNLRTMDGSSLRAHSLNPETPSPILNLTALIPMLSLPLITSLSRRADEIAPTDEKALCLEDEVPIMS
jgi:hypothetical protein